MCVGGVRGDVGGLSDSTVSVLSSTTSFREMLCSALCLRRYLVRLSYAPLVKRLLHVASGVPSQGLTLSR